MDKTQNAIRIQASQDAPSLGQRIPFNGVVAAGNAAVIVAWLWLFHSVIPFLGIIATQEDFRTNQLALFGVLILVGAHLWRNQFQPRVDAPMRLFWPGLALALGGMVGYVIAARTLNINTISAGFFGLVGYGLLGLWMRPDRWRDGLPVALLLIAALPFGEHLQTVIGYPMRLATAAIVRDGVRVFGVTSIGVDTILVFENGISTVDVPCSGVKSLWSGALFLLAATWIERRRLNLSWLAIAGVFVALLFLGNLARVGILVVVGEALGQRDLAAMLHVPLGVGVFALTCLAPYGLLRRRGRRLLDDRPARPSTTPRWLAPALAAAILAISAFHSPRTTVGGLGVAPVLRLPATMTLQEQPLTERESEWLTRDGADWFQRFRFTSSTGDGQTVAGSVILVQASTWRAHHRPERCFEVLGIKLGDSRTDLVAPDFPIRVFRVGDASAETYAAAYWYQSPSATTDDFGARVWADLTGRSESWMLVSLVLENQADPASPPARAFIRALRDAVAQSQSAAGVAQPANGGIHGNSP